MTEIKATAMLRVTQGPKHEVELVLVAPTRDKTKVIFDQGDWSRLLTPGRTVDCLVEQE